MAIEARSLSDINKLAANPSQSHRPGLLLDPHHETLTLYIVRVPGSRDVFLTTLKPKKQVVNAHDVQSSLYFLHVSEETDTRPSSQLNRPVFTRLPSPSASSASSHEAPVSRTFRKPLPTPPTSPEPEKSQTALPCPEDHTFLRQIEQQHRNDPQTSNVLTLIRRDPSSGEQWNVATIRDACFYKRVNAQSSAPEQAVRIDIMNRGYSKFTQTAPAKVEREAVSNEKFIFSRILRTSLLPHGQYQNGVVAPKSFAFTSPWGGLCELTTGLSGRTLKCKHMIQGATVAAGVSELRFDLPTFRHGASGSSEQPLSTIKEWYHKALHAPQDYESTSDYSLGRERAGGGLVGTRAKLGKLIIQGEGLQMLDLVVAANMALWWRAYER